MSTTPPKACCGPSGQKTGVPQPEPFMERGGQMSADAVRIPGGKALIGTRTPGIPNDGETPLRTVRLSPFRIGATAVTNAQFETFVTATGYRTEAETFGWSFVFRDQVPVTAGPTRGVVGIEWWRQIQGANWRDINGPDTQAPDWHPDHPVVHVSWNDACAYAKWVGGRLPTEAEWEHAARGGLGDVPYPWGTDDPDDTTFLPCNIWQGTFPDHNSQADGYAATAPARSFQPNGYGLYNLVGNVWEWTSDTYRVKSLKKEVKARLASMKGYKLSKGGSFLCHRSYCYRYRIAARHGTSPDSSTTHQGFRVVWDD